MSEKVNKDTSDAVESSSDRLSGIMAEARKAGYPYTCGLDMSLHDTYARIQDSAKTSIADHYGNSLNATGTEDKVQSFTNYGFSNDTLNYYLWLALYNDSWVFRKAIDKPAQDQVNSGFTLLGDHDFSKVYRLYNKNKQELTELLQWGALFGGSVAVFLFDGITDEEMCYPLQKDKIKGKRFKLYVTDRWYGVSDIGTDTVTDMRDVDFGKPKMYNITFADGHAVKVHHSYVLRYEHRTAPRLIKNGQLQGWGYAEGAHILNELSRDDQLKSAITSLVNKSLIEVIKMAGMRGVFMGTDKGNEEQLRKRLEMVNWGRTYNSLTFLDKDDEYQPHELGSITGLANLMETNMWVVAAAVDMPGILFGDLKGGLATESDAMERYALSIINRANAYFRPVLSKFLKIVYLILGIDDAPDFEFNSLNKKQENTDKVKAIEDLGRVLGNLHNDGIISRYQAAISLRDFMNKDIIMINFSDEELNKLKLEEQQEILDTIKNLSKAKEIKKAQFPNEDLGQVTSKEEAKVKEELANIEENAESESPESEGETGNEEE